MADPDNIIYNPRSTSRVKGKSFHKTSDELSLENEARELVRCRELSISTAHVMASELIDYDAEKNILTTRYVHGGISLYNSLRNDTSVVARLRGKGIDEHLLLNRIKEIGEWLKLYHDSSEDPAYASEAVNNFYQIFKSKIDLLRTYDILNEEFLGRIEKCYLPEIKKAGNASYQAENHIRFCRIHSDFIASNQMKDAEWNVYILDFADSRIGASVEDLGRFYEQLFAIGQTGRYRKKLLDRAIDVFLQAYGVPLDIIERPFFKAVVAYNGLISCISEYMARPYIRTQYFTRVELKRLVQATLNRIAGEVGVGYKS